MEATTASSTTRSRCGQRDAGRAGRVVPAVDAGLTLGPDPVLDGVRRRAASYGDIQACDDLLYSPRPMSGYEALRAHHLRWPGQAVRRDGLHGPGVTGCRRGRPDAPTSEPARRWRSVPRALASAAPTPCLPRSAPMSQPPYPPQGGNEPGVTQPGQQGWNPPASCRRPHPAVRRPGRRGPARRRPGSSASRPYGPAAAALRAAAVGQYGHGSPVSRRTGSSRRTVSSSRTVSRPTASSPTGSPYGRRTGSPVSSGRLRGSTRWAAAEGQQEHADRAGGGRRGRARCRRRRAVAVPRHRRATAPRLSPSDQRQQRADASTSERAARRAPGRRPPRRPRRAESPSRPGHPAGRRTADGPRRRPGPRRARPGLLRRRHGGLRQPVPRVGGRLGLRGSTATPAPAGSRSARDVFCT